MRLLTVHGKTLLPAGVRNTVHKLLIPTNRSHHRNTASKLCRCLLLDSGAVYNRYAGKCLFVKVDADKCEALAQSFGIRAMPTFVMLAKNGDKLDEVR